MASFVGQLRGALRTGPRSYGGLRWTRSLGIVVQAAAKTRTKYKCRECGFEHSVMDAICRDCGQRDTLEPIVIRKAPSKMETGINGALDMIDNEAAFAQASQSRNWVTSSAVAKSLAAIGEERNTHMERIPLTGITGKEVSRVLGGGIMRGTLVLVGGDPGVGKSTLLLQVAAMIAEQDASATESDPSKKKTVLYISGEESDTQIYSRAKRLDFGHLESLYVMTETKMENILAEIDKTRPDVVFMDSIQSIRTDYSTGGPGSYCQVRDCGIQFSLFSKNSKIPIFIVGHVTKSGEVAGPKVLEHIVDVVLYLEGEKRHFYRILRGVKNRYGSTDEIGIFEMMEGRIKAVENPNAELMEQRASLPSSASSAIAVSMDGLRPILVEIQALCTPIRGSKELVPYQARSDLPRLYTISAILRRHVHCKLDRVNLLVNITGGMKLRETAGDLAVAVAVASAYFDQPVSQDVAFVGELGLGGEIRPVDHIEKRLAEVAQLGFTMAVIPRTKRPIRLSKRSAIMVRECASIVEVLELVLGKEALQRQPHKRSRDPAVEPEPEPALETDSWNGA